MEAAVKLALEEEGHCVLVGLIEIQQVDLLLRQQADVDYN